jgi:hypothetical protein
MQDTDYVPKIAAEGDSVSVIWNGSDENDIQSVFYCRSIDAGVTWESTQNLTTGTLPQGKEIKQGQETLAGKGTYVYALFVSTGANIYLRRSISGGTTFAGLQELTTTSNAGGNLGTNNGWWPVIGTDPSDATGATVYAMWTTPTYVYSRDGGATFTKPTVIIPYFSLGNWPFSAPRTRLSLGEDGKFHYTVISQFTSAELCGGICDPDIFYRGVTQSPLPISTDKALKIVTGRDLDRYDNMQVRATDWLNFSSRLTAEVWVKPAPGGETTGTTSASKPIFYKQSVGGSNLYDFAYSLLTHDRYGQRQARGEIRTADGTFGVNPYSHTEGLVPDGTWTHLAMTYDAAGGTDNLKLYMNGLLIATATATGNLATEDGLFFAGKYGIWEIDELRLWAVVRTQSEIASNMRIWLTGNETGLNAYYNFNGTTRDITRHGNDGILMYKEEFVPSGVVGINPLLLPSRGGWRATLGQ